MGGCSFLIKSKDKEMGESTYYLYHYLTDEETSDIIETAITFRKNKNKVVGNWSVNDIENRKTLKYKIKKTEIDRDAVYVHSEGITTPSERVLSVFKLPFAHGDGVDFLWGMGFGLTIEGNYPYAVKMLLSANKLESDLILKIFRRAGKIPQNSVLIERDLMAKLPDDDQDKENFSFDKDNLRDLAQYSKKYRKNNDK